MFSKSTGYYLVYSILSIAFLAWSVEDSLRNSINFNIFLIELADGFKLSILINFIVFLFITIDKALIYILFGELRMIESEHLRENVPYFILNFLFNFAANDSNHILTIALMGLTVSSKIFHVILVDRLDYMNMKIMNETVYTKYAMLRKYFSNLNFWLNLVFIVYDFAVAKFLVYDIFKGINSVTCLLFGFQFAIQGVESLAYYSKLLLDIFELVHYRVYETSEGEVGNEIPIDGATDTLDLEDDDDDNDLRVWENKPYFSKGIDISSESLKAISHLCFVYLLSAYTELSRPLSMIQGTYSSLSQLYLEIKQLMAFIESTKRLDSQLPTATKEDLEQSDNLCIICREDMHSPVQYEISNKKALASRKHPKKLACGHFLHMGCLKEWLERSDTCPMCRRKVFESQSTGSIPTSQGVDNDTPANPVQHNAVNTEPPFNHPVEELERRLEEFTNLIQRRENNSDDATGTPPEFQDIDEVYSTADAGEQAGSSTQAPSRESEGAYQSIRLPSNAILPPNWILLPLETGSSENSAAGSQNEYRVNFSTIHQGSLKVKQKQPNRELSLIRPS